MKNINILVIVLIVGAFAACDKQYKKTVYGARITSFSPASGYVRDTIEIFGENFKQMNTNIVYFSGDVVGNVVENTGERLLAVVPDSGAVTGPISVRVSTGEWTTSQQTFTVLDDKPIILKLSRYTGKDEDEVLITGANFAHTGNKLYFEDTTTLLRYDVPIKVRYDSIFERQHKIQFVIPEGLPDGYLDLYVVSNGVESEPVGFTIGTVYHDDFNRTATEWVESTTNPNPIGSYWMILNGSARIYGNNLQGQNSLWMLYTGSGVLDYEEAESFRVSVDVKTVRAHGHIFAGLILFSTSTSEYYIFRMATYNQGDDVNLDTGVVQLIRNLPNGGETLVGASHAENSVYGNDCNKWYRMEVFSDTPGVFECKVTDIESGVVFYDKTLTDTEVPIHDIGYCGVFNSTAECHYDNFTLAVKE